MTPISSPPFTEHLLLQTLAASPVATAIYSGEDVSIQFANDKMLGFWGKDRSVVGQPLSIAVPELEGQDFLPILQDVWRTGISYRATGMPAVLNTHGYLDTFYFDFVYEALKDEKGDIYCILNTATDVTERVKFSQNLQQKDQERLLLDEQLASSINSLTLATKELTAMHETVSGLSSKLANSEGLFKNIFEQAPLGLAWLRGPEMVIEQVNAPMLKIWGRTTQEVKGKPIRSARPELEGQTILDRLQNVYDTGTNEVNTEYKILLKDGDGLREAYVNSVYSPLRGQEGEVEGILVIVDEITDRIAERQHRALLEEQFRISVESANLGTWFVDLNTGNFIASTRLKELFGFHSQEDITLEQAVNQIREDYRAAVYAAVEAAISNESGYDIEYPVIGHHDQKLRWVRATGKVFSSQTGQVPHFSGVMYDITNQKLEEKRKQDFIAIASHELKTPLTSAKGYLQLLLKTSQPLSDKGTDMLKKVGRQIEKMQGIINSFLDVARVESSSIQLNKQTLSIRELLDDCRQEASVFTQEHEFVQYESGRNTIVADREKIGQVLSNFLTNAIKYTPGGGTITLRSEEQGNYIGIYVTDTGMGISPQDQQKLFTRFYRVENPSTRSISGFGIGLYLCAEIIRLHGGIIGVDSEPGKGSTFYFLLPVI